MKRICDLVQSFLNFHCGIHVVAKSSKHSGIKDLVSLSIQEWPCELGETTKQVHPCGDVNVGVTWFDYGGIKMCPKEGGGFAFDQER